MLLCLLFAFNSNAQITTPADNEWDSWFMPGLGYKFYSPKNAKDLGTFSGPSTEFIFYARAKNKESNLGGPSRIKSYGNLSMLNSTNSEVKDVFLLNLGSQFSFESKTDRHFLIPTFGLEFGGIYQKGYSSLHLSPFAGIHLVSTRKMVWDLNAGYMYTLKSFEEYSGMSFSSTVNLLLWQ